MSSNNTISQNLLTIVQDILQTGLDSDNVNSINDTEEALQVAQIVRNTYFDMVSRRELPEHKELSTIDSLADSTRPTFLVLPDSVKSLERLEYNVSEEPSVRTSFRELCWKNPEDFLEYTKFRDDSADDTTTMSDVVSGVSLTIRTNKMPTYYTSFDNKHIVCDSYKSSIDSTLQTSKTRSFVVKFPVFDLDDTFTPDINDVNFRTLINEAKSMSISVIQKNVNPKVEQAARTQKVHTQNDRSRLSERENLYGFGRKRHSRISRKKLRTSY